MEIRYFERISICNISIVIVSLIVLLLLSQGIFGATTPNGYTGEGTKEDPYIITDIEELQSMKEDLSAHYILENDIDGSKTNGWNDGAGFQPLGDEKTPFTGSLDGNDNTISDITINQATESNVGLFGSSEGVIKNVHLEGIGVEGKSMVGGLIGYNNGKVHSSSVSGEIRSHDIFSGGLIGWNYEDGTVIESYTSAKVNGNRIVGGLIGQSRGEVIRTYSKSDVSGHSDVGGLIGAITNEKSIVRNSYATGNISGTQNIGGLSGSNRGPQNPGTIFNSVAISDISGEENVGGIVGSNLRGSQEGDTVGTYWLIDYNKEYDGIGDSDGDVTGVSNMKMTGGSVLENMDKINFATTWTPTDQYPLLQWQVEDISLAVEEQPIANGDTTEVTVTVTRADGSTTTASEVAEYESDTNSVSVEEGLVRTHETGTAEITASLAGHTDSVSLEVREPPAISTIGTDLEYDTIGVGSVPPITATVENDGGMTGEYESVLSIDGYDVETTHVSVGPDQQKTIEFDWIADEQGAYEIAIDDVDAGTLEVLEPGNVTLETVENPDVIGSEVPYEVTVSLANDGDVPVTETITYHVDGKTIASESVLVPAEGATRAFEHSIAERGPIEHEIVAGAETVITGSDIEKPASIVVSSVDGPTSINQDESVTITAEITNAGGLEGTDTITVYFDDTALGSETITLGPSNSTVIDFEITPETDGSFEYGVESAENEESATIDVDSIQSTSEDDSEESDSAQSDSELSGNEESGSEESDSELSGNGESGGEEFGSPDDVKEPDDSDGIPGVGFVGAIIAICGGIGMYTWRQ